MADEEVKLTREEAAFLSRYMDVQRDTIACLAELSERAPAANALRRKLLPPPPTEKEPS